MSTNKKPVFRHLTSFLHEEKRLRSHKIFSQKGANVFLIHKVGKPKKQQ